jgi:hypothetical protein
MDVNRIGLAAVVAAMALSSTASAQWVGVKHPGVPRNADGKVNLDAPAPKTPDGKPDLSGTWLTRGIYIGDIAKDLKEPPPMQPWAAELYKHRRDTESKEDPTGWCVVGGVPRSTAVPYPFKIINSPGMVVILYEAVHSYRQIFADGRALPTNPNPQWFGYSVGKWEGDTFVVSSIGFNDNVWLDNFGHPAGEALKVTEKFRRKDFGHLDVEVTIDDPKTYTRPWTVTLPLVYQPDSELIEYMCTENNKDVPHLVGK